MTATDEGYAALVLSPDSREKVLARIGRPIFPNVYLHHATLAFGIQRKDAGITEGEETVIWPYRHVVCDKVGVEFLLVIVNGEKKAPDGRFYHITISTAEGVKPSAVNVVKGPVLSNMFLAQLKAVESFIAFQKT